MPINQNTFLFYDIETTGLNKCFDQVLQFAAIRTDLNLNEINRYEFLVRLNPDIIPNPEAIITHRLSLKRCEMGLTEIDAIQKIHDLMNTPGTISVGYNSLRFDDEFLRFSFYRNLLAPYTHQHANQCSRMDLYPITIMYYLFKKKALNWPEINGRSSLKLEHLKETNLLSSGVAHNAMVDVEATVALAKKLIKFPDMWQYVCQYFDKQKDQERMLTKLESSFETEAMLFREALLIHGQIGYDNNFQAPVLGIGNHKHYKNQTLWLRLDLENLQQAAETNLETNSFVFRKKFGEDALLLPYQERFLKNLTNERIELTNNNKIWLRKNSDILQKICEYHQNYKFPKVPNLDIDAALYDMDFASPYEDALFKQFHQATPENKLIIAEKFPNSKRKLLAVRIMGRHYPEFLTENYLKSFNDYLAQINSAPIESLDNKENNLVDYRGENKLTANQAIQKIEELRSTRNLDEEQIQLLNELRNHITEKAKILQT